MNTLRFAVADGLAITVRNLRHVRVVPEKLVDVTVQPLLFVLLFAYVFGGSIDIPDGDYKSYIVAGLFVQTLAFATLGTATSMADDLSKGIIDRFRALPMSRSAVLVGRTLADLATTLIGLAVLTGAGLAVGWRIDAGVPNAIAGYALLLLFALAMSWVGTLIGLLARSVDAVAGFVFVGMFPLTFVATTFVTADSLPAALKLFAQWNPVSAVTAAVRELFGNPAGPPADPAWPLAHPVLAAVLWCVGLIAVCAPLAVRRYLKRT